MKNHHLAKAIADAGWAEFMRQCEYKAKHEGRIFAKIGTFFPSSKTCSACGHKLKELSLATRSWTCPHCGAHHDRDINASLNINQPSDFFIMNRQTSAVIKPTAQKPSAIMQQASKSRPAACISRMIVGPPNPAAAKPQNMIP